MIFMIIYIYSYVYLCIYTPSYQHFKAFAVSKFDSETTFQREFKVHSLKAIQHVSSGIHVYMMIEPYEGKKNAPKKAKYLKVCAHWVLVSTYLNGNEENN